MLTRIHKAVVMTTFLIAMAMAFSVSAGAQDRADFSFRAIDGATVTSDSLRGQVVVLAFGASWLPLTRNQMEGVKKLADQYAGRNVVTYWVSTDSENLKSKNFVTDDELPHRGTLDLKTRGTRLFVDAARVFALADGIADTGTAARLRAAGRALRIEERYVEATIDAFHFLQSLRLRQQDNAPSHTVANRLNPDTLNEVDQRMLKEAFRQVRKLQERLKQAYQL